jgi:hypothetical protein
VTGVKDFDVYAEIPGKTYPPRWRTTADFGSSRFGRRESEPDGIFLGRRVDLFGRSLPTTRTAEPLEVITDYLTNQRTASARLLAAKAVVIVEPLALLGTVVWAD